MDKYHWTLTLGVLLAQLVENVGGIETGVVAQLARNDLQALGDGSNQQLLLTGNGARIVPQQLGQLHFNGTAAGHNGIVLDGAPHDHNCVVEGSLSLLQKLFGTATQNKGARLGIGAAYLKWKITSGC